MVENDDRNKKSQHSHESISTCTTIDVKHCTFSKEQSSLLSAYDLHGWSPDMEQFSLDENYMDLVLLLTRQQSELNIGHCACILVSSSSDEGKCNGKDCFFEDIIGAATNQSLFKNHTDCDIHAEISCLQQAHENSAQIRNSTAYITLAPCKPCFAALVQFGVSRIVSRRLPTSPVLIQAAKSRGIELVELSQEQKRTQMKRLNQLLLPSGTTQKTDAELMEFAIRRKQWRYQQKQARRQQQQQK